MFDVLEFGFFGNVFNGSRFANIFDRGDNLFHLLLDSLFVMDALKAGAMVVIIVIVNDHQLGAKLC